MSNVIECKQLSHAYGKRIIYENLNFSVPQGRIMGLLGKNGTGKTTTINILNGYLKPLSGSCTIFGEECHRLTPATKARIGLLIEGHVQYNFMRMEQLERFYSAFYPAWSSEIYHTLTSRLKVNPRQTIGSMSNGQRSQVALGVVLAQEPDLLILDDFSLGLDPGYRRLFTDILKEYTAGTQKTIFLTSHIIQDMERLIDDCIVMGYGGIIVQKSVGELMERFRRYTFEWHHDDLPQHEAFYQPSRLLSKRVELFSFLPSQEIEQLLTALSGGERIIVEEERNLSLEDIFIGLTGKY